MWSIDIMWTVWITSKNAPLDKNKTLNLEMSMYLRCLRVFLFKSGGGVNQFSSLNRFQICPRSSVSPSHSCPLVACGGKACGAARRLHQRPLPPRSTWSMTEGWLRCHNGPLRWLRPCRLWCLCPLPGPSCMLLSSPGHCSPLEGIPEAGDSGGRRRWRWERSAALQCRFLQEKREFWW